MSKCGIIAEFNPFHNGHAYLINEIKSRGDSVICALSGNFAERGDVAIFDKQTRVKCATLAGADLCVEIPTVYSMSTAQNFALAGVWQLYNLGCEKIAFGSESGDTEGLKKTALILNSDHFAQEVSSLLKSGETFAKIREKAALNCGADISFLRSKNDNLAVEYILAALKLRLPFEFCAVKRVGDLHDGDTPCGDFASGSYLRNLLKKGNFEAVKKYMPANTHKYLKKENIADIKYIDRSILAILRLKSAEDFKNLPDLSEGIENRLFEAVKTASSFSELCEKLKTKRYTMARVRRLILSAALGITDEFFLTTPPYTRILGSSDEGLTLLKNTVSLSPVLVKSSDIKKLDEFSQKCFNFECNATDLFSLCFENPREKGGEMTAKFIKKHS